MVVKTLQFILYALQDCIHLHIKIIQLRGRAISLVSKYKWMESKIENEKYRNL